MAFALIGDVVHAPTFGELEFLFDHVVVVDKLSGVLLHVEPADRAASVLTKCGVTEGDVTRLQKGSFIVPGFIDVHTHAPQYAFTGTATDTPLMEWLGQYTFPCERAMAVRSQAEHVFRKTVRRLLSHGTTTALYFASIHLEASKALADVCAELGQRAYVGKVCMDRHGGEGYVEDTASSLQQTEEFIRYVREGLGRDTVQPVVTPRFVPTCTPELLDGLGKLASQYGCHVQSHVTESVDQVQFSTALHPEDEGRDVRLFQRSGLLTKKAVLAHAVLLTDEEFGLLAQQGTAIAHCPLSNFYFAERHICVKQLLRQGVKVGLATDMAGGYSPSMLSALRCAVLASRAIHISRVDAALRSSSSRPAAAGALEAAMSGAAGASEGAGVAASASVGAGAEGVVERQDMEAVRRQVPDPPNDPDILSFKEAFWLGTVGSAQALGIEAKVGTIQRGKEFDAQVVDCGSGEVFDTFPSDSAADLFEKWANLGDDRNVTGVWVKGRRVKG